MRRVLSNRLLCACGILHGLRSGSWVNATQTLSPICITRERLCNSPVGENTASQQLVASDRAQTLITTRRLHWLSQESQVED